MRKRKTDLTHGRPVFHDGVKIEVVLVEGARRLYTHIEGNAVASNFIKDVIVKLVPDDKSTPESREALKMFLLATGAAHVWIAPRPPGARVVPSRERTTIPVVQSPRELIMKIVDESHSKDRELLRTVVDTALAKAKI